jgi:hypothetical protein
LEPLSPKEIGAFLTEGMDEVFGNGDSFIPGVRALEMLFQEPMLSPVEA